MIQNDYNVLLVAEGVRPAMLVQPADYGEATGKDPQTKSFLDKVKREYPQLIHSEEYDPYQGIILSKKKYKGSISLEEMGRILGYHCSKEFKENTTYVVELVLHKDGQTMQLLANMCTHPHLKEFKELAKKAKRVFDKHQFGIDVKVVVKKMITTDSLLKKCIQNKPFTQEDKDKIKDIFFNFGWSNLPVEYENPLHRGILMDILLKEKNDTLSPFYPLQHHKEHAQVNAITKQLERDLVRTLKKTRRQKLKE